MSFENERIQRMLDDGLISEQQAATLDKSINAKHNIEPPEARRKLPLALIVAVCAVIAVIVLMMAQPSGAPDAGGEVIQKVSETLNTTEGVGQMNKGASTSIGIIILMLPILLSLIAFVVIYNGIVSKEETVMSAWSQVESNYQRRADLIPNLVESVSQYMKHEHETQVDVAMVRSDAINPLSTALDAVIAEQEGAAEALDGVEPGDETAMGAIAATQKSLGLALNRLLATAENYPDLRAADNFMALQSQLEGTENRINVARMEFNDAVKTYNEAIRKMPGNLVAGVGNFKRKAYFQSESGSEDGLDIDFGKDAAE